MRCKPALRHHRVVLSMVSCSSAGHHGALPTDCRLADTCGTTTEAEHLRPKANAKQKPQMHLAAVLVFFLPPPASRANQMTEPCVTQVRK